MALSDRIALLRAGLLEQVAEPREIYGRPASAYAAQFIGQTNLLRANVEGGLAQCGALRWQTAAATHATSFSLRPESIRLAASALKTTTRPPESGTTARFRGRIRNQTFGGAMDVLEIDCGNSQIVRARVPSPGPLTGEHEFEFNPSDAVAVRDGDAI